MGKRITFTTYDKMNMACHNAPRIHIGSFIALAVAQTIQYYFAVFVSYKDIYPVNNSKRNKEEFCIIIEFVFSAHG